MQTIYSGDARLMAGGIVADESISLIFTDPVYENIEDYEWVGGEAMRSLKPDSACLVWTKTSLHDEAKAALVRSGLRYRHTLYYACSAKGSKPVEGGIFPWVTPCLYFTKGKRSASPFINDWYFDARTNSGAFKWNKSENVLTKWLLSFSDEGDLIYDPFAGSGSLGVVCKKNGRRYVGFEIDPERARLAQERIDSTQVLFAECMIQTAFA